MESLKSKQLWEEFFKDFCEECKELYKIKGFTYSIPKEEHIRSALYSFLKTKGCKMEVESDFFEGYRKDGYPKQAGEYDIRIISPFSSVIEIKRASALKDWQNGYSDFLEKWRDDIKKLEKIGKLAPTTPKTEEDWNKINRKSEKCFVLITFSNKPLYDNLKKKSIDEFNSNLNGFDLIEHFEEENIGEEIACDLFIWTKK
ncbi:MAG: hypothetical protein Q7J54_02120 [Candidatus Woesearchaeota archaeon]|nr:hypothetical protein [Candidatus Woesearchaeota archaeon]